MVTANFNNLGVPFLKVSTDILITQFFKRTQVAHADRKLDVVTKMLKTVLQKQDEQSQLLKAARTARPEVVFAIGDDASIASPMSPRLPLTPNSPRLPLTPSSPRSRSPKVPATESKSCV